MNIQDAIRSGKPFRRKGWGQKIWLVCTGQSIIAKGKLLKTGRFRLPLLNFVAAVDDILSTDWEVKE